MDEGKEIRFIDLFSGIGGFRLGLERANHSRYEEGGRSQILQENGTNASIERLEGTTQGYGRCLERANQVVGTGANQGRDSPDFEEGKSREQPIIGGEIGVDSEPGLGDEGGRREPLPEGSGRRDGKEFRCVWSCDNDRWANQIYFRRFKPKQGEHHTGDIRRFTAKNIPDHDLLCAGFPCQAFSFAGKRKGFGDTRGTLFHEIARIARVKRPPLLLLENVKGLLSHDKGQTFGTILEVLGSIGYRLEWQVLNSKWFGVPQNRERVFIVGHLGDRCGRPIFPFKEIGGLPAGAQEEARGSGPRLRDEHNRISRSLRVGGSGIEENLVARTIKSRYYKDGSENLLAVELAYTKANMKQGRFSKVSHALNGGGSKGVLLHNIYGGFGEDIRIFEEHSPTIRTAKGGGHLPSVLQDYRIRRLTPVECERLQGFPDSWTRGIADTNRYKCLGNAVTVPVITFLGRRIMEAWKWLN